MPSEIIRKLRSEYTQAVLAGYAEEAHLVISRGLAGGIIPSRLYLEVLMPAQVEIGARWHRGDVSIPQEHIATQITLRQMGRLRAMLKTRVKLGLRAVVSSVEGDHHFIGAQAVADFLVVDGWEVDFLGADVPTDHLVPFARAKRAHLVCVSVSLDALAGAAARLVAELHKLPDAPKVLVGGPAFLNRPDLIDSVKADGCASDPHQAVTLGRQLCGLLNSKNALDVFLRKLGNSIHEYRKLRGMSQQDLAKEAELDRAYISSVEHGKQNISIGAIAKLAKALDVTIEEVLLGSDVSSAETVQLLGMG